MANLSRDTLSVTFSGTGTSDALQVHGGAAYQITIGTGTVKLEGSLDGTNFVTMPLPDGTTAASWTASTMGYFSLPVPTWVRFNCTAYTSGVSALLYLTPGTDDLS